MKKFLLILLALVLCSACAQGEAALDYALWLEEALTDASFADAEVPGFVLKQLGADYEFIARSDAKYGSYIAGVRKDTAPRLPEDVHQSAYGGTFETRVFQAADNAGKVYYEFALADGVYMQAYDGLDHLLIFVDPEIDQYSDFQKTFMHSSPQTLIFNAADPQYRARMRYAAEKGFSLQDESRSQLCFPIHSLESWRAGATDQPTSFYLDMTPPNDVLGKNYLDEDDLIRFTRIPIGLYLKDGKTSCELVLSEEGTLGVETYDPHRLYEPGPGCEAILDLAEKLLGYRPGKPDFLGKASVGARLEWQERKWFQYDEASGREIQMGWDAGSIAIDDAESLRRLDAMLSEADFSVGSVNCPSNMFLVVDYSDGSSADFAVAVNSFDLFFRNGLYFTAGDGELIDLFNLKNTAYWKGFVENEPYVQG